MSDVRVLYDGWSLVYQPDSPSALHLLALLAHLPANVQPIVALPRAIKDGWEDTLPPAAETYLHSVEAGPRGRLWWEQRYLPQLAQERNASLVHLTTATPALFGQIPTLVSPAEYEVRSRPRGFSARLRRAVSAGAMERVYGLLWPEDLSTFSPPGKTWNLPVLSGIDLLDNERAALDLPGLDLPEAYFLYHGPSFPAALRLLLDAWSWAAGPLGEYTPLVCLPQENSGHALLEEMLLQTDLQQSLRLLPPVHPKTLPALYQGCTALIHPAGETAWGGPVRFALASGKPVVAAEERRVAQIVGEAGYLANTPRDLGAALITVAVEESMAESLSEAALKRSGTWQAGDFKQALAAAYSEALAG